MQAGLALEFDDGLAGAPGGGKQPSSRSGGNAAPRNLLQLAAQLPLRVPEIVCLPHWQPQPRSVAAEFPQPNGHLGCAQCGLAELLVGRPRVPILASNPRGVMMLRLVRVATRAVKCRVFVVTRWSGAARIADTRTGTSVWW